MIAVTLSNNGVEINNLPIPEIKHDQVLVKVYTCGLNRSDLLETQGQSFGHTGGEHKIIGGEFAGEVVELGKSVNNFNIGESSDLDKQNMSNSENTDVKSGEVVSLDEFRGKK